MPGVIDADTHIAESEAMWQMIDEKMYPRRPVLLSLPDDTFIRRLECDLSSSTATFSLSRSAKAASVSSPHRLRRSSRTDAIFRSGAES